MLDASPAAAGATRSLRLRAATVRRADLDRPTVDAMWALFERYYEDVRRDVFERDLSRKDLVITCRDSGDGSLQGFSTAQVLERTVQGRPIVALYSGDTVIERAYWGQSALQWEFVLLLVKLKARHPLMPVYWFLLSKGYRTYLLMSRNFPIYWPHPARPTPPFEAAVIDALAAEKFGASWRPALGTVRIEPCPGRLRGEVAPISEALLRQDDIRFFTEKNPRHAEGEELCCLAPLGAEMVRFFTAKRARKLFGRSRGRA